MRHFNGLTPAEAERLAVLLEELGEAQQIIGKILRHGYESYNPFDARAGTNRSMLERELGDVQFAMGMLANAADIDGISVNAHADRKAEKIGEFLHHQKAEPWFLRREVKPR